MIQVMCGLMDHYCFDDRMSVAWNESEIIKIILTIITVVYKSTNFHIYQIGENLTRVRSILSLEN